MENRYYISSQKFGPLSIVLPILLGGIVGPLLAFAYAYFIWYMPFIYLNFLGTFLFAIGLAVVSYAGVNFGKNRNKALAIVLGAIVGVMGLYAHWAVWIDLVMNAGDFHGVSRLGFTSSETHSNELIALVTHPLGLLGLMAKVAYTGVWSIRSVTVSGIFLWIIWFIEAAIIIGFPAFVGHYASGIPFDETTEKWATSKEVPTKMQFVDDFLNFTTAVENQNYEKLLALVEAENPEGDFSKWTFYHTEGSNTYFVSVSNQKSGIDSKGNVTHTESDSFDYLCISNEIAEAFIAKYGG